MRCAGPASEKLSGSFFPEPGSEAFWRAYGEDVVAFSAYAVRLHEALLGLRQKTARKRAPISAAQRAARAGLAAACRAGGVPRARFASASLMGPLAAMAVLDIEGGTHFEGCCAVGGFLPRGARTGSTAQRPARMLPRSGAATGMTRPTGNVNAARRWDGRERPSSAVRSQGRKRTSLAGRHVEPDVLRASALALAAAGHTASWAFCREVGLDRLSNHD